VAPRELARGPFSAVGSLSVDEQLAVSACMVKICVNWCPCTDALLDSGAAVNVLSYEYWSGMTNRLAMAESLSSPLLTVSGEPLHVCGTVNAPIRMAGVLLRPNVRFFVVNGLPAGASIILGLEFVLQHVYSTDWKARTLSLQAAPLTTVPLIIQPYAPLPSVRQVATAVGQPTHFSGTATWSLVSLLSSYVDCRYGLTPPAW